MDVTQWLVAQLDDLCIAIWVSVLAAKFSFIVILLFDVNILIGIFLLIEIFLLFLFLYIFNRISSNIH